MFLENHDSYGCYHQNDMDDEEVDGVLPLIMDSGDEDEENPYDVIIHPDHYEAAFNAEDDEKLYFIGFY
ncbi:Hypothetical predicted protein [Octopus vulgaris]|uniref:Uncharacterized protein n=1 Tax=Octopus vulgaris TaxID=6645 RepID=A0AA36FGX7_OCTVU|nr:Hypothetical predicted protein [Octopus vulgaris]